MQADSCRVEWAPDGHAALVELSLSASADSYYGDSRLFLISRDAYFARPDLQFTGRTVMGAFPARGQEMSDHYMAPLSDASPALACMQAIQEKCFKMGIPLRTRHREVAPNQYEFAPMFGTVVTQSACPVANIAAWLRVLTCMRIRYATHSRPEPGGHAGD